MAAPLGNQFWKLRSKHGRDKLFANAALLWEAACEYFQWCEDTPLIEVEQTKGNAKPIKKKDGSYEFAPALIQLPKMRPFTMQGLCRYLQCNTKYFNDFEDSIKDKGTEDAKDFSEVITRIRETIYEQKFTGAASGFLNPNIIARDLGLVDKSESKQKIEHEVNDYDSLSDEELSQLIALQKKALGK